MTKQTVKRMLVHSMRSETREQIIVMFDFSQEYVSQATQIFRHSAGTLNNHKKCHEY